VKSFAILRTNVGLTTNVKVMVDSNYNLSLNSIESKEELSNSKFKKVSFIKNNYYDELIPYFYDKLPSETAFFIKYEKDVDSSSKDYSLQYDEIYQYGARNIINNKNYKEEFEYFAPLYISTLGLPKNFIIFRVDGPGVDEVKKENFKSKILNNLKTVKIFDLTKKSVLGEWLDTNFSSNSFFPLTPFEMSFDNLEFSKWNGIDYETGGYTSKSMFLESVYREEKEIFEFERFIFDGYKNNKIVFPNILNMSFLFDDTPANSDTLRKWSINRYYGFYIDDMVKVTSISPYITPFLKNDVVILDGNILQSPTSEDPFMEGFLDHKIYYVEYNSEYYKVEKFVEEIPSVLQPIKSGQVISQEYSTKKVTKYRIISDINLSGKQSMLNKNTGLIGDETTYPNRLLKYDNTNYEISDWDTADVWLIEIDGVFHNLVREKGPELVNGVVTETTRIRINSDYSFKINENDYTYFVNKSDPSYTKKVSFIVDANNPPKKFNIYKLKFTDIKDFDTRIVDTEYSKFEYEKKYDLTETDESKMYMIDLSSKSIPRNYDDFVYKGEVINIPVSSEYTANYETFKIDNGDLSEIWRKNDVYCRWGFQNSISANDVPYLLNNSLLFEDYNRTTNPFDPNPKRIERNLDYFYTINSSTYSYVHHSLHVEKQNKSGIDTSFKFELNKYLNLGTYSSSATSSATYIFDYFSHFFEMNSIFDNYKIKKNSKKYSLFNKGDKSIPNITLFRGLKFLIYDIENARKDETGKVEVFNLKTSNSFDGYKFSILLSDNDWAVIDSPSGDNFGSLTQSQNLMSWTIFDDWKMDKTYQPGDIVVKDDILYQSSIISITTNPIKEYSLIKNAISAPYNQTGWTVYTPGFNSIFWNPTGTYPGNGVGQNGDVIYNNGDYYYYTGGTDDLWNPVTSDSTGYSLGSVVLFKGQYYMSMTSSNNHRPDYQMPYNVSKVYNAFRSSLDKKDVFDNVGQYYWVATQSVSKKWSEIQIWNPSLSYASSTYVVHEDIVYQSIPSGSSTGNEPGVSSDWIRVYSLVPDTSIIYNQSTNPIIEMNNSYYMINSNTSKSTLQNGINIYINKKWKNILINIDIADNTIGNLSESDRDILYNELNSKLTAYNFIQSINDLSSKNGFTDYVNYIIINEDGTIKKYNYNNIEGLPYFITCETPDEVVMKYNSINYKPLETPKDLKPTKVLKSINNNLDNLNYYNNVPIAADITSNKDTPKPTINYSGAVNITDDIIYRFSGFYMPIFYSIDLFESPKIDSNYNVIESNYKFDTTLTNFGLIKERKIRKVNHKESILKLYNVKDLKSIYPMIDEFGYTTVDTFIFKSTWDNYYHYLTSNKVENTLKFESDQAIIKNIVNIGIQDAIKNINL